MAKKTTNKNFKLNVVPSAKDKRDYKRKVGFIRAAFAPATFDATNKMTSIKDQGIEGGCTGFATVAWLESMNNKIDLSERMVYENARKYDEWPGENYEGSSLKGALKAANKHGACEESFWPYTSGNVGKPKKGYEQNAEKFKVGKYALLMKNRKPLINQMCKSLSDGLGVIASIKVSDSFIQLNRQNFVLMTPGKLKDGGHAIAVVGYDKAKKLVKIRNSWSSSWGMDGYGYISFAAFEAICFDLWCFDSDASMKTKSGSFFSFFHKND